MIYITGDTHGTVERFDNYNFNKEDKIIILGDFGFLFQEPLQDELNKIRKLKESVKQDILFLDGNHENFNKLNNLEVIERYNSYVGKVIDGVYHLKRGNIYTIEDKTFFTMGGALSIDKHLRMEDISWWKDEEIGYNDIENGINNLEQVDFNVDYVLTHTQPQFLIDSIYKYTKYIPHNDKSSKVLDEFNNEINFKYSWMFGHLHFDRVYMDGKYISLYENIMEVE